MKWVGIVGVLLFVLSSSGLLWVNGSGSTVPTAEAYIQRNSLVEHRKHKHQVLYFTANQDAVLTGLLPLEYLSVGMLVLWFGSKFLLLRPAKRA